MAYAEIADIESNFKDLTFAQDKFITPTDVEGFITQAEGVINTYLGMRYLVPVASGEQTLNLLKLFVVTLVSERVKGILEVKQGTNSGANQNVKSEKGFTSKDVMEMLKKISTGDMPLTDQTLLAGNGAGVFYSNNYSNNVTPVFKKDVETW